MHGAPTPVARAPRPGTAQRPYLVPLCSEPGGKWTRASGLPGAPDARPGGRGRRPCRKRWRAEGGGKKEEGEGWVNPPASGIGRCLRHRAQKLSACFACGITAERPRDTANILPRLLAYFPFLSFLLSLISSILSPFSSFLICLSFFFILSLSFPQFTVLTALLGGLLGFLRQASPMPTLSTPQAPKRAAICK